MIEIIYRMPDDSEGIYSLEVNGHAGYDKEGKDIVCAGVSALVQALAYMLDSREYRARLISLAKGYARIEVDTRYNLPEKGDIAAAFDVVIGGLAAISEKYKKNIKISKKSAAQG